MKTYNFHTLEQELFDRGHTKEDIDHVIIDLQYFLQNNPDANKYTSDDDIWVIVGDEVWFNDDHKHNDPNDAYERAMSVI